MLEIRTMNNSAIEYNTIIIGGGVGGLTAGMYLARANTPTLILEGRFWGGQTSILASVENYPGIKKTSGFEISQALYEQVKDLDIDMKNESVVKLIQCDKKYLVETNQNKYLADNIIIATGAKTTTLGLKEEKQFIGKGISYCATCDGNFFKGMNVAVYGLGNTALEDVKYLCNLAKNVYWIIPNKSLNSKYTEEIKGLKNLEIKNGCDVTGIIGENSLQQIELYNKLTKQNVKLSIAGLFVALGRQPDLSWLEIDLKTNKKGYIIIDKNCQTSHKNIYACGDITSRQLKQIVTACSDGAIASTHILSHR